MSIREISVDKLRRMEDQEGLIIQGCGGDLQEWVDGINEILTEEGILKKGTKFEDVYSFQRGEVTCLLFPFKDDVPLDVGKLAMWRLQTYQAFGSTWLSDYVPNELGGFLPQKPDCSLKCCDGNIFNIMGKASQTLRAHRMKEEAQEMRDRVMQSGSYGAALRIIGEYVNITFDSQSMESENWDMEMQ